MDTGDRFLHVSVDKIKPYKENGTVVTHDDSEPSGTDVETEVEKLRHIMSRVEDSTSPEKDGGRQAMTELDRLFGNVELTDAQKDSMLPLDVFVVKILSCKDERAHQSDFVQEKAAEVEGLNSRGLWKKILNEDAEKDGTIMGGRFILSLKNYGTPAEQAKFRYIAQGYNYK